MTENVEHLILEHLRSLRAGQDNLAHELREVQVRISSLEAAVLSTKREHLFPQEDVARQQVSIDALKERLTRVERRLEIRDDPN